MGHARDAGRDGQHKAAGFLAPAHRSQLSGHTWMAAKSTGAGRWLMVKFWPVCAPQAPGLASSRSAPGPQNPSCSACCCDQICLPGVVQAQTSMTVILSPNSTCLSVCTALPSCCLMSNGLMPQQALKFCRNGGAG